LLTWAKTRELFPAHACKPETSTQANMQLVQYHTIINLEYFNTQSQAKPEKSL